VLRGALAVELLGTSFSNVPFSDYRPGHVSGTILLMTSVVPRHVTTP
jgi:hypothetical protein